MACLVENTRFVTIFFIGPSFEPSVFPQDFFGVEFYFPQCATWKSSKSGPCLATLNFDSRKSAAVISFFWAKENVAE